jgi:hypothetical protein
VPAFVFVGFETPAAATSGCQGAVYFLSDTLELPEKCRKILHF